MENRRNWRRLDNGKAGSRVGEVATIGNAQNHAAGRLGPGIQPGGHFRHFDARNGRGCFRRPQNRRGDKAKDNGSRRRRAAGGVGDRRLLRSTACAGSRPGGDAGVECIRPHFSGRGAAGRISVPTRSSSIHRGDSAAAYSRSGWQTLVPAVLPALSMPASGGTSASLARTNPQNASSSPAANNPAAGSPRRISPAAI